MSKIIKGRSLSDGIVEGEAIITKQPFSITASFAFPLISNAKKLKVADKTHELYKKDVKEKVLIFPYPIGTTTLGFVLLETIVRGISPKAIVCSEGEPLMSSGAVAADIFFNLKFPIVDKIDFSELEQINNGDLVRVNGNEGFIEIL
ncbi:MAG: aconitase X swivel domain-containing protein [Candidatus Hermodarchaeota archaeon]